MTRYGCKFIINGACKWSWVSLLKFEGILYEFFDFDRDSNKENWEDRMKSEMSLYVKSNYMENEEYVRSIL